MVVKIDFVKYAIFAVLVNLLEFVSDLFIFADSVKKQKKTVDAFLSSQNKFFNYFYIENKLLHDFTLQPLKNFCTKLYLK